MNLNDELNRGGIVKKCAFATKAGQDSDGYFKPNQAAVIALPSILPATHVFGLINCESQTQIVKSLKPQLSQTIAADLASIESAMNTLDPEVSLILCLFRAD